MNSTNLLELYNQLKTECGSSHDAAKPLPPAQITVRNLGYRYSNPKKMAYRTQSVQTCEAMKESAMKRLLLDIYMKILPFDAGFADANRGQCQSDVDAFLADKKLTASEYFQSAYDETKAPLLEYVIRVIESMGKEFMSEAMEKYEEAEEAGVEIPAPNAVEEEQLDDSLVDVTGDLEYEGFIDKLKRKTVNKIVKDITALINDKKTDLNMTFTPATESVSPGNRNPLADTSAFAVAFDYIVESYAKARMALPGDTEPLLGLAIRESTLHDLDCVFNQPGHDLEHFTRKVRRGQGVLVTERVLMESLRS